MKKILFMIMICSLAVVTYLSFGTTPDITILSISGVKLGINYSQHLLTKLICSGAVLFYILYSLTNKSK